jgi:hypothetical protein
MTGWVSSTGTVTVQGAEPCEAWDTCLFLAMVRSTWGHITAEAVAKVESAPTHGGHWAALTWLGAWRDSWVSEQGR